MQGLQIGKVLQVHEDPLGQNRIKVTLPGIDSAETGHWVRLATPFAGVATGMQFYPEVDDEVVLGFLQADPEAAIVLGALHSANRAPPLEIDEKNTLKGLVTTSLLKLTFDEEKKVIAFETPGGHSVTLDDEATTVTVKDSSDNKIVLSESGIELSSASDLVLKASGDITLQGTGVTIDAKSDLNLTGQNVTAEGQMGLTAKGGTQAELSSSGSTSVKGTMVNIN